MTVSHHPSDELLFDYASGALGEAWSLAIATHLALCPRCRAAVSGLERLGGELVEAAPMEAVSDGLLDAVLTRVDAAPAPAASPVPVLKVAPTTAPRLPQPLRDYVGGDVETLPWRRLGRGAYQCLIPLQEAGVTARLLRIPAGKPVPEHSHGGLELTLVLCGAFSDDSGTCGRGDLQEADETTLHQPHAAAEKDCICLAITDAPLRFKSLAARMVQPLLGI